jgi:hypothetical protein
MAELGRRAGFRNQSVNSGAGSNPASCTMVVCAMIRNRIRCAERIECHHARCIDKTRGVGRAGRLRSGANRVARKGPRVRIPASPPIAAQGAAFILLFDLTITICYYNFKHAPVAQLDRVTDYESVGRRFEPCLAHHWRVAQRQSTRLLTEGLWVRIPPCQPSSITGA